MAGNELKSKGGFLENSRRDKMKSWGGSGKTHTGVVPRSIEKSI